MQARTTRVARSWRAVVTLAALVGACGGDDDGPDVDGGGGAVDASRDAAGGDASGGDDAGAVDAGRVDAGPAPEACRVTPAFDEGVTYERTLYVAPGGSGDGTMGNPFGTIRAAAMAATPGTRILVAAGSYGQAMLPSLRGEPGRPIAIVGEGEVVIDGGAGIGLGLSDGQYVVLQGLTLRAGVHGMNLDDGGSYDTPAHHLVLRDITIPSAGSGGNNDCIKMSGVDDFWIIDSDIAGCNRGELVDMVGCHRGVIAGNYFHEPVGNGVQAKGGSSDILITGNRFERIPGRSVNAGGSTGLEYFRPLDAPHEAARIHVLANVFVRGGAESGAAVAFVGCDACVFAHNTVIEPQSWVARVLQESTDARFVPSRDGVFSNNVIVLDTSDLRTFFNVGANTAPETFRLERNLWYAVDQGAGWTPSYASLPAEIDPIVQMDPALVDRAGGNYRLGAESPARGAGRPIAPSLPPDMDRRCFADPPSLGAYEHAP